MLVMTLLTPTSLVATAPLPVTLTVSPPSSALMVVRFVPAAVGVASYTRVPLMFVFSGVIVSAPLT